MRIPQRPAWPVVFLLAAGISPAAEPLEALSAEIARWKRIQTPESPAALNAFQRAYAEAAASWTARWPEQELAWRERLRALARIHATPEEVENALAGAARTRGIEPGLRFPEDTRFLMARTAIRHGVRLDDVQRWLTAAVDELNKSLPEVDHPLAQAYRQERLSAARWRAAQIRAEAAYRAKDCDGLRQQLAPLTAESVVAVADPADRLAVAERARRRAALFLWRARLARLEGAHEPAACYYQRALQARPVTPGMAEPPENASMIEEAEQYAGLPAGSGTPIPPAIRAAPHWLPSAQRLEGFEPDGRPAVAVIWDGAGAPLARALERLERYPEVRVLSFPGASPSWIGAVNPLYTAPQLWIVDPAGVIRLVGRFLPGGDGWEDAVAGAALRSARPL